MTTVDDTAAVDLALLEGSVFLIGIGLLGGAFVLGLVAVALYRSGARQKANAIVTALSLLAVLALLGYIVGGDTRAELIPVASLAVGALAAALGQMSSRTQKEAPDTPTDAPGSGDVGLEE